MDTEDIVIDEERNNYWRVIVDEENKSGRYGEKDFLRGMKWDV